MRNGHRFLWSLLVLLSSAVFLPSSFAESKQMEDRDRSLDWVLGGLEQGSRITRSTGQRAPAGSRTTLGSKVSPSDAGANRTGRGTAAQIGVGVSGTTAGGSSASGASTGTSGQRSGGIDLGTGTGTGSSSGETTSGGETTPGGQTTSGGETTDSGLNIHVEADTSSGNLSAGAQTETTETSLDVATGVETGTETGTDLSGQVDVGASTDTSDTTLIGSAELTSPGTIDTSTATELESNLSGGGNDASTESDSTEATVGDNADDCSVAGLISCPSIL